jgi:hypothetical protein
MPLSNRARHNLLTWAEECNNGSLDYSKFTGEQREALERLANGTQRQVKNFFENEHHKKISGKVLKTNPLSYYQKMILDDWLEEHPGKVPGKEELVRLTAKIGASFKKTRQWFYNRMAKESSTVALPAARDDSLDQSPPPPSPPSPASQHCREAAEDTSTHSPISSPLILDNDNENHLMIANSPSQSACAVALSTPSGRRSRVSSSQPATFTPLSLSESPSSLTHSEKEAIVSVFGRPSLGSLSLGSSLSRGSMGLHSVPEETTGESPQELYDDDGASDDSSHTYQVLMEGRLPPLEQIHARNALSPGDGAMKDSVNAQEADHSQ